MMLDVTHKTLYRYSSHVSQSQHLIHMSPRLIARQHLRHHSLIVEPAPAMRTEGHDAFGNPVVILEIEVPHKELDIRARSTVETLPAADHDFGATTAWDRLGAALHSPSTGLDLDVIQFTCPSRQTMPTFAIADYARQSFVPERPVLEAAFELVERVYEDFKFDATATDISTPITRVFAQRRGVCQDFAHLTLAALRALRVPARYVSGYILTRPPPGQPKLQGTDASHAWISVWAPETGWVDLDPTNGLIVSDEHVTIAHGRDYDDICPISGVLLGGGAHTVSVGVDVVEVD